MKGSGKGEETSTRIIEAATAVFSEVGLGGARVDEIARRAGVNKATLYYHIGDKNALYAAVLHSVIGHTAERIEEEINSGNQSPEEKFRSYVRGFAQAIEKNPRIGPIMMRELAAGGKNLPALVAQDFARVIGIVTSILEEGYRNCVFIKATPYIVHMMAAGGLVLYRASGPIRANQPDIPEEIRKLDLNISERVAGEIEQLILNAITKKTSE